MWRKNSKVVPFREYNNLPWSIRQHGDDLEHEFFSAHEGWLLNYDLIWSSFIGRNSKGMAADLMKNEAILKPGNEHLLRRNRVSQFHYTILESYIALDQLNFKSQPLLENIAGELSSLNHISILDFLVLFHAYLGRIAESLEKSLAEFAKPSTTFIEKVTVIKGGRNIIIHGARPTLFIDHYGFAHMIAPDLDGAIRGWDDKTSFWNLDEAESSFTSIVDYAKERMNGLIWIIDDCFASIYFEINKYMRKHSLSIPDPPHYGINNRYSGRSGIIGVNTDTGIYGKSN